MTFFYSSWVTNLAEVSTGLKPTSLCCPVTVFSPRLSLSQLTKPSDGLTSRPFFLLFILFSPIIIQSNTCSVKKMQESPQEKKKKIRPAFKYCFFFEQQAGGWWPSNALQQRAWGTALHSEGTVHKRACEQATIHHGVQTRSTRNQTHCVQPRTIRPYFP